MILKLNLIVQILFIKIPKCAVITRTFLIILSIPGIKQVLKSANNNMVHCIA